MWAHQYLQAVNEINAIDANPHVWQHDNDFSETYGLEPNYGCCTANFHQVLRALPPTRSSGLPSRGVALTLPTRGAGSGSCPRSFPLAGPTHNPPLVLRTGLAKVRQLACPHGARRWCRGLDVCSRFGEAAGGGAASISTPPIPLARRQP